ncbi:MAG: biotin--[acetyl-CoA-carboxylase] ligase, partial [Spirochaetes bacterium GWB1_59_5]
MESLKAWGYGIEASRKGYELAWDDGLAGWELDSPGPVLLMDSVGSTMDEARRLAFGGAPSGASVMALRQTAGRGRNGSVWDSPSGGLYLSVVIRSRLPLSHGGALSLETALITLRVLAEAGASSLEFDWPNSLASRVGNPGAYLEARSRKVGGILVEAHGDIGASDFY